MPTKKLPTNLLEAVRYFSDLDVATDFIAKLRWPDGPICPNCGGAEHSYLTTRRLWKCKACKKQFSVKVGTVFEDSPLGLDKWLPAVWLVANSKNGISSHELGRALGTTQKSAWFMLHRVRLAMQTGSFDSKIAGEVEVDETYVGGRGINMHKAVKRRKAMQAGPMAGGNKTPVVGVLARGGEVRAAVVQDVRKPTLQGHVRRHVEPGSSLFSDMHHGYTGLNDTYDHAVIDHAITYVDGRVHTNGLENFWSLLKRGITGTYIGVEPCHLFRYLDERVFTYNLRNLSDFGRFEAVLRAAAGRRLTYMELTGHA